MTKDSQTKVRSEDVLTYYQRELGLKIEALIRVEDEIKELKAENATLRSELSAYKEGIEPEDAEEFECYNVEYEHPDDDMGQRSYLGCEAVSKSGTMRYYPLPDREGYIPALWVERLYPLPHQQKGGKDE